MRILFYTHSLTSDWNHGNAHFLRGVMRELTTLGHEVLALEPANGWSRKNLKADQGSAAVDRFARDFPGLRSVAYGSGFLHEEVLQSADVVIVHEWTERSLVERIGRARQESGRFTLLFHDTHHRAVSAHRDIEALHLEEYDGVLAFGESLRQRYLGAGWGRSVFTWHEAADTALFKPISHEGDCRDLIWIGNWGDNERSAELREFLIEPAARLGLSGTVRGVRYPRRALDALAEAGLDYGGWIANADVPAAFACHRATMHIPRRPYVKALPGIPTIRVFEALACGIPLISAPWNDTENLFRPGEDFLFARNGAEMSAFLREILADRERSEALAASGLETIRARHTCRHRARELLSIVSILDRAGTESSMRKEAAE
ncbi:CgeB family protein [Chelativorans salis]|uniref:Glycosyltransferase n=1 Tax=Chelativorans salis TaxID=2978478 RepID=A0ABT2LSA6_9HYPH|nr:glycosyltransferase [Chelativorans sp. EGI FJ00035]MCT7377415.1 glycosyltransferase [Chelativorans sp. EGI FJ00035]